jgi:hypothetical protein
MTSFATPFDRTDPALQQMRFGSRHPWDKSIVAIAISRQKKATQNEPS